MRTRLLIATGVVALVAVALGLVVTRRQDGDVPPRSAAPAPARERRLTIGLWGDIPYTAADAAGVSGTIESMNTVNLDFSVFDGDLKGGGPCDDRVYTPGRRPLRPTRGSRRVRRRRQRMDRLP